MSINTGEAVKTTADIIAAGVTIGVLAEILPVIAALLTIIWTALRIYEAIEARFKNRTLTPPKTKSD
jgi:hypothetical protein